MALNISTSFTAVDTYSSAAYIKQGESFNYSVSGTFVGSVKIEKSQNGGIAWLQVGSSISSVVSGSVVGDSLDKQPALYRLNCTSFSSGTIVTSITQYGSLDNSYVVNAAGMSKVGAAAGWVVDGPYDTALVTCPQSQTASTLIVFLPYLKVGQVIKGFYLVGQIESAGNTVTVDAELRKQTAVAADVADASVISMAQVSVTADTALKISNAGISGISEVVSQDCTYYVLITATTDTNNDIALQGVGITVEG